MINISVLKAWYGVKDIIIWYRQPKTIINPTDKTKLFSSPSLYCYRALRYFALPNINFSLFLALSVSWHYCNNIKCKAEIYGSYKIYIKLNYVGQSKPLQHYHKASYDWFWTYSALVQWEYAMAPVRDRILYLRELYRNTAGLEFSAQPEKNENSLQQELSCLFRTNAC